MHLTILDHFFWAAGLFANLILLLVLVYRRRVASFPFFTSLIALLVCKTILLYFVLRYGSRTDYFYCYWLSSLLDACLQLGVIYEVTRCVLGPLEMRLPGLRSQLFGLGALSLGGACVLTWLAHPVVQSATHSWLQSLATRGNLFAAALMSELFAGMLLLAVHAGVPWRGHGARIALGVGAFSLTSVLVETGHTYFGVGAEVPAFLVLSYLRMSTYLFCVIYWVTKLWPDERPALVMPPEMREKLFTLQTRLAYSVEALRSRKRF